MLVSYLRCTLFSLHFDSRYISYTNPVANNRLFLTSRHAMQASGGSSVGARAALLRLSIDLKLHPTIVAAALEYAFDNHPSFSSASQAFCFGIVRQGHCANMQILDAALQRLRQNFGGLCNREEEQLERWTS